MSTKQIVSFQASTTIPAYYIVTMLTATANYVKVPAAVTEVLIGITTDTVLDTGSAIPVQVSGVAKCYFNDSCASGVFVAADTSGRAVAHSAISTGSYVIGVLIGPKVEDTGTVADVLIMPQFYQVP